MQRIDEFDRRMKSAIRARLDAARADWNQLGAALSALSPLRVLERGYSLTTRDSDGAVVRHAGDVVSGDRISTRLADSTIRSRVE
jgi:exodeoxyribonuclease VII large subunit